MQTQLRRQGLSVCALSLISWMTPAVQNEMTEIHVEAAVVDAPCGIALSSRDQTYELPPIPRNTLNKPGKKTQIRWFNIRLRNCLIEESSLANTSTISNSWSSLGPMMAITFDGARIETNPGLFSVTGTAKGIGMRLFNAKSEPLIPGTESPAVFLTPGENLLTYGVAVERDSADIQVGVYRSVVSFKVTYE